MGAWMLAMNVEYEDNRALCDPACHNNSVAVWDIPKCPGKSERTAEPVHRFFFFCQKSAAVFTAHHQTAASLTHLCRC